MADASQTVVTAHVYESSEFDEIDNSDEERATVRLWCFTAFTNEPIVVTIRGVRPWCFVELPRYHVPWGVRAHRREWTPDLAQELVAEMRTRLSGRDGPAKIVSGELVFKSKLYYYQPRENAFPMLRLTFDSLKAMKSVANQIESAAWLPGADSRPLAANKPRGKFYGKKFGRMVLRCWEHDITMRRKINTIIGLKVTQWFDLCSYVNRRGETIAPRVVDPGAPDSVFTCTEYEVRVGSSATWKRAIVPLSDADVSARKIPASAPKILGYDIETYTNNHRAFPNAKDPAHCVMLITCVCQRARDPSSQKRIVIATQAASVSQDLAHPAYASTGTRIDEFIIVRDEAEMLDAFSDLIAREDPDVITGYNINGYDAAYLDMRYQLEAARDDSGNWPQKMARALGDEVRVETRKWFSKGTGTVESTTIKMEGRLTIDLMPLIKRDHKLTKYNLNTVSQHFLGNQKHDVEAREMFVAFEAATKSLRDVEAGVLVEESEDRRQAVAAMTRVAAYGVQDSVLVVELFEKLNVWIGLVELSSVTGVTIAETYSRGQQCRVVSLLYNVAAPRNIVLDKRRLPAPRPKETASGEKEDDSIIRYTGGYVGQPIVGLHDNVLCMDFASLYPSIMIAQNICLRTLMVDSSPLEGRAFSGKVAAYDKAVEQTNSSEGVLTAADSARLRDRRYSSGDSEVAHEVIEFEEGGGSGVDPHVNDVGDLDCPVAPDAAADNEHEGSDIDDDGVTTPPPPRADSGLNAVTRYAFKYVKPEVEVGLLPTLVKGLLDERKRIRGILSDLSEELRAIPDGAQPEHRQYLGIQINVLNQRQLAIKVTANSVYGVVGAQRAGSYSLVEGAMSITAFGRQLIKRVYDYVETTYGGRIIGGDTDSCFFQLPNQIRSLADTGVWGRRLAKELTDLFPRPLTVEFEKAMRMLAFKKKMYAALIINDDGTGYKPKPLVRGIVLARRDKCRFLTGMYEPILIHALNGGGVVDALKIIGRAVSSALVSGDQARLASEFEVVNSIGAEYKKENYRIAVFVAECQKSGYPMRPGDRVGYVIVREPSSVPEPGSGIKPDNLGLRMRLTESWRAGIDDPVAPSPPIDVLYYITNWCQNPIDQLINVAYGSALRERGVADAVAFRPRSNTTYRSDEPIKLFCAIIRHTNSKNIKEKRQLWTNAQMAKAFETIVKNIEAAWNSTESAAV